MMKKLILFSCILFMFESSGIAQCLNINGDMENHIAPPPGGGPWINDNLINWYTSHGDPYANTMTNIIMNSNDDGIYTEYSFFAGYTYTITYSLYHVACDDLSGELRLELTNSLTPDYTTSAPIPTPSSQSLASETITNSGSWVTVTQTFVATNNYSQLWIYPIGEVCIAGIDNVCITTEPCDASFSLQFMQDGDITAANVTLNNLGQIITNMDIYENGILIHSGLPMSPLLHPGNSYKICVTTINGAGVECTKCFDFCIGEGWTDGGSGLPSIPSTNDDDHPESSELIPDQSRADEGGKSIFKKYEEDLEFTIMPNPSSGSFDIMRQNVEVDISTIEIFDINMKLVHSMNSIQNKGLIRVDLNQENSGIYFVRVTYSDGSLGQKKIVIK